MKTWRVYLSDYPNDPLVVRADSHTRMKWEVEMYKQRWNIDATIDRVEEVDE